MVQRLVEEVLELMCFIPKTNKRVSIFFVHTEDFSEAELELDVPCL